MNGRSLSEIAYEVFLPGGEVLPEIVDAALIEAGINPTNETERERFHNLVLAAQPLKKQDELARCCFADEARKECGPDADIDLVIQTAEYIEERHEDCEEDRL